MRNSPGKCHAKLILRLGSRHSLLINPNRCKNTVRAQLSTLHGSFYCTFLSLPSFSLQSSRRTKQFHWTIPLLLSRYKNNSLCNQTLENEKDENAMENNAAALQVLYTQPKDPLAHKASLYRVVFCLDSVVSQVLYTMDNPWTAAMTKLCLWLLRSIQFHKAHALKYPILKDVILLCVWFKDDGIKLLSEDPWKWKDWKCHGK